MCSCEKSAVNPKLITNWTEYVKCPMCGAYRYGTGSSGQAEAVVATAEPKKKSKK